MTTPDAIFGHPRLAAIYDALDADRSDLDHYAAMVEEFDATSVLDVGCGTGVFACEQAMLGRRVVGVDPALASLDVAKRKPGGDGVTWVHGDVSAVGEPAVDMASMTGNVAQVFLGDDEWQSTLTGISKRVVTDGHLVFETRAPDQRVWDSGPSQTRDARSTSRASAPSRPGSTSST